MYTFLANAQVLHFPRIGVARAGLRQVKKTTRKMATGILGQGVTEDKGEMARMGSFIGTCVG